VQAHISNMKFDAITLAHGCRLLSIAYITIAPFSMQCKCRAQPNIASLVPFCMLRMG
jgi:hypothetical protein